MNSGMDVAAWGARWTAASVVYPELDVLLDSSGHAGAYLELGPYPPFNFRCAIGVP